MGKAAGLTHLTSALHVGLGCATRTEAFAFGFGLAVGFGTGRVYFTPSTATTGCEVTALGAAWATTAFPTSAGTAGAGRAAEQPVTSRSAAAPAAAPA